MLEELTNEQPCDPTELGEKASAILDWAGVLFNDGACQIEEGEELVEEAWKLVHTLVEWCRDFGLDETNSVAVTMMTNLDERMTDRETAHAVLDVLLEELEEGNVDG